MSAQTPSNHFPKALVISVVVAIILLGMNMRSPIIGFGAVTSLVQADLGLSTKTIGFIGAVPMFAFAFSSFLAPKISHKIGLETTMLLAALLLTIGIIGRVWSASLGFLLAGTVLLSLAISLGNVLVPAVIKKYTATKISLVLGLYSLTSSVFAGIASGVAMPLAQLGNELHWQGWRFALGIWSVLAGVALLAWVVVKVLQKKSIQTLRLTAEDTLSTAKIPVISYPSVWRISMAWWISGYMGLQSLLYYTLASFLPSLLIDKGLTPEQAGRIGMIFQFVAFPSILLLSHWVAKGYSLRVLGMAASLGNLIGVLGFGFLSVQWAWLWSLCAGFGCGVIFTLSLMIFTLKSRDSVQAGELSGMAQSVGYSIAILGPFGVGWLKDISGGWVIPWAILGVLMVVGCVCGWFATANKALT